MAQKRSFAHVASEWSLAFAIMACLPSLCRTAVDRATPFGTHGVEAGGRVTLFTTALAAVSLVFVVLGILAAPRKSNWTAVWTLFLLVAAVWLLLASVGVNLS